MSVPLANPALQALIDGMLEAVWMVDPLDLRVVAANQAAHALLGVSDGALLGRPAIELAATPEDMVFWEDVAAGLSDRILSDSLVSRADGSLVQVERRVSLLRLAPGHSVFLVCLRDRTEQRRAEDELERLVSELRATLESTADGILAVDLHGAIRGYNQRLADLWKFPQSLMLRRDDQAVFAWLRESVLDVAAYDDKLAIIARSPLLETTDLIALKGGRVVERVTRPQYSRGRPIGRVYSFRDITQQLANESQLQLAAKVFEASPDAVFVTDADLKVLAANPGCERLCGNPRRSLLGRRWGELIHDPAEPGAVDRLCSLVDERGSAEAELYYQRNEGGSGPCQVSMVRLPDESGGTLHYIAFVKDLTDKLAAKRRIEELAYTDALTGQPNRLVFAERVDFAIAMARREQGQFAVMFIDLDRFKHINDSLGHLYGDRVLVDVAERLKRCVREVDTVARYGGDEFVVLLHQADARGAESTARRIQEALNVPVQLDDLSFTVTGSIGIAMYPVDGATTNDLIKNADAAMYRVKERGRASFRFYQPQMNVDLLARMKIDHAMRQALPAGHFRLAYQPQVDIRTQAVVAAEALLRWRDPDLGDVSPAQFIPVAEESGFIVALGDWVLTEAVRQAAVWQSQGQPLQVSVNVSALQFQQATFVERVAGALESAGLAPELLELELTETILIQDAEEALTRLRLLERLGVRLAIDDFGTGYSSLGYLKRFPIGKLKIDRSFISGLPADESDAGIVRAVVSMARALHLKVIAEGVETDLQRQFLAAAGCDQYQGYLFAPAVDPERFAALRAGCSPDAQPCSAGV